MDKKTKALRRMSRSELLEILLEQSKKIAELEKENETLKKKLESKEITIARSGSIAEAALRLSGVFEAVEKAADLYLTNVEARSVKQSRETETEKTTLENE